MNEYTNLIINPELTGQHFANYTNNPSFDDVTFADGSLIVPKWWAQTDSSILNITNASATGLSGATNVKQIIIDSTFGTADKKFGIAQFFEESITKNLWDRKISISFSAAATHTGSVGNLKCAVLLWAGTANSVQRQVALNWNSGTPSLPTLTTNWEYINTPSDLSLSTGWSLKEIPNISIPSGVANIAVFIWSNDSTIAVGKGFKISKINMNIGSYCKFYNARNPAIEYDLGKRYAVHSGNINSNGIGNIIGYSSSTTEVYFSFPINKPLMKTPSVINYDAQSYPFLVYESGVVSGMPLALFDAAISQVTMNDSFVRFKVTSASAPFTANKQYIMSRNTDLCLVADC